jgi:hypothetical protein
MLTSGAVLNERAPGAVIPASAQLRVEDIEGIRVQRANFDLAQQRRDVVADVTPVERQRASGTAELVEVALQ